MAPLKCQAWAYVRGAGSLPKRYSLHKHSLNLSPLLYCTEGRQTSYTCRCFHPLSILASCSLSPSVPGVLEIFLPLRTRTTFTSSPSMYKLKMTPNFNSFLEWAFHMNVQRRNILPEWSRLLFPLLLPLFWVEGGAKHLLFTSVLGMEGGGCTLGNTQFF